MSQQEEDRVADSQFSQWGETSTPADDFDAVGLSAARARAIEEAGHSIAHRLNGPLTALLLYMEELRQHSHRFAQETGERDHLQRVIENAWQQTERVCALVKQFGGAAAVPARSGSGGMERVEEGGR